MQRFIFLDGLRGIAAIAVMIHHFTVHANKGIFSGAGFAVDIFFCLSGFVLTHAYLNRFQSGLSLKTFFLKRFTRLYPLFFVGTCLGIVAMFLKLALDQTSYSFSSIIISAFFNILYLPFFSNNDVFILNGQVRGAIFPTNDPGWSLFFEWIANIFFACLFLSDGEIIKKLILILFTGYVMAVIWVINGGSEFPGFNSLNFLGGFPRVIVGFFSGALIYFLFQKFNKPINQRYAVLMLGVLFLLIIKKWPINYWLFSITFLIPTMIFFSAKVIINCKRLEKICIYLGWLSYPLYCLHYPLFNIFTSLHPITNTIFILLIYCPLTILIIQFIGKQMDVVVARYNLH